MDSSRRANLALSQGFRFGLLLGHTSGFQPVGKLKGVEYNGNKSSRFFLGCYAGIYVVAAGGNRLSYRGGTEACFIKFLHATLARGRKFCRVETQVFTNL